MLALLACLLTAGCSADERFQGPDTLPRQAPIARPVVSAVMAPVGSRIAVAVETAAPAGVTLGSQVGALRFDPATLSYMGQAPYDSLSFPMVVVNDSRAAAGELQVSSVDPHGLSIHPAVLAFEVRAPGYAERIQYTTEQAVALNLTIVAEQQTAMHAAVAAGLVAPSKVVRMKPADWDRLAGGVTRRTPARLLDSVPTGRRYSDVELAGPAGINALDVLRIANWGVHQESPAGTPIPAPGDLAELVGNVGPANLPGLGEATDSKGPGWNASCIRIWDALDQLAAANEAVQQDVPVAGDVIPQDAVDPATKLPRRGSACPGIVPAFPPDSVPAAILAELYASSNMLKSPIGKDLSPQNLLLVAFKPSSSAAERQVAIDAISGVVVGGQRVNVGAYYYVRIPSTYSSQGLKAAIDRLKTFPQVDHAIISFPISPNYRRPVDGVGWKSWQVKPSLADSANWALEAIGAPMAWGCDTGSAAVTIGVVDANFGRPTDLVGNISNSSSVLFWDTPLVVHHGTSMASIIGATGNNVSGIAGVNWRTDLLLVDLFSMNLVNLSLEAQGVAWAARHGARIVNLSLGINWSEKYGAGYQPHTTHDSLAQLRAYLPLKMTLDSLQAESVLPLLVVAAGNDGISAWWSGLPAVAADYPNNVVVVGGASLASSTIVPYGASNIGSLVTLVAPAGDVTMLRDSSGATISDSGTSASAAFVSGVAGLLLSFDPTLSNARLKELLVEGAQAGNISVDGKLVLNAYESLRIAAKSPGAPLCSNRVWSSGGTVYVERQGGPQVLSGGTWTLNTNPSSLPIGLPSSVWTSEHGTSHDVDSVAYANSFPVAGGRRIDVSYGTSSSLGRAVGTMTIPLQTGATDSTCGQEVAAYDSLGTLTGYQCVGQTPFSDWGVLFPQAIVSPLRDRILIVINRDSIHITGLTPWVLCLGGSVDPQGNWSCRQRGATYVQFSQRAEAWQVPLAGGTPTPLWSRPSQAISWLGFSEDAGRAVMGTGTHSISTGPVVESYTNCAVEYISPSTGIADTVVPSPVACRESRRGPGGFAPIRTAAAESSH